MRCAACKQALPEGGEFLDNGDPPLFIGKGSKKEGEVRKRMKKTKLKAFIICLIIFLTVTGLSSWIKASDTHGEIKASYTDSDGGRYTLYADGYLYVDGYTGGEPDSAVLGYADDVKSVALKGCVVTPQSGPLFKTFKNLADISLTDTALEGDMSNMFAGCKNVAEIRFNNVEAAAVTSVRSMFDGCASLRDIDISGLDLSNAQMTMWMFRGCESLRSIDMSGMDLSKVKVANLMFDGCTALESADLSGADLSGCVSMVQIFEGCTGLKYVDMSDMETSDAVNAYLLFENCRDLETVDMTGFNFGKTSLYSFFQDCSSLREAVLTGVDTSNVTAINFMFAGCTALKTLDLSDFDTGNIKDYYDLFNRCTALEYLDVSGWEFPNGKNQMDLMFDGLVSLKEINLSGFKTAGVTDMSSMFRDCKSLESLDLSGFDTSSVEKAWEMFKGCVGLKYLDLSNADLQKAVMYQAFNGVGFWELKLPKTQHSPFPCFADNTPIEKPYYTWDGDWSCYIGDNPEDVISSNVLQSDSDITSPEQTSLDAVRFANAATPITIIANFTPIEYPVTLHDKEITKEVSYNVEKLPYTPSSEYTDKEHYTFDGFSLTEDAPVIEDFAITLDGSYKIGEVSDLYLHYTPTSHAINISFIDTDGKEVATDTKTYSIEDKTAFLGLDKDYAEGMCPGYGFVGFTCEKLGITGVESIPAPEEPCGGIDITVVMEPPVPTEPETTENVTQQPEKPAETTEGTEEASSAAPETTENASEQPGKPAETTEGTEEAPPAEPGTTENVTEDPDDTEPSSEPGTDAGSGSAEPVTEAKPGEVEGNVETSPEETNPPHSGTVNTGDKGIAVWVIVAAVIIMELCLVVYMVIRGRSRKGKDKR